MNGKTTLYIDQYGNQFRVASVKELRSKIGSGGSRVSKMYVDQKSGGSIHIGYVVGKHWLTAFQRVEKQA